MRTTNQKIVFSWILYFTDIFTKSQRQKRPAAGGESCKAGFFFIALPLRRRFCFYRFFLQFLPIYLMIKNVRFYKNLMIYILFLSFEYIF